MKMVWNNGKLQISLMRMSNHTSDLRFGAYIQGTVHSLKNNYLLAFLYLHRQRLHVCYISIYPGNCTENYILERLYPHIQKNRIRVGWDRGFST